MTGGTRLVIFGAGFNRDGRQGKTVVYIGTDVCRTIEYDSDDSKITCYTPSAPMSDVLGSANELVATVRVAMITIGSGAGTFWAECRSSCTFTWARWVTPLLQYASLGGSEGSLVNHGGMLHADNIDQYTIAGT